MKGTYPKFIGIGGPSRSGKSTLTAYLSSRIDQTDSYIFDMDDYVKEKDRLPRIRDRIDWESPETIDLTKLLRRIETVTNHYRYIFIEGIFAFHYQELNVHYDLRYYLKITKEKFHSRRRQETRWGMEPDWYLEYVWSEYLRQEKQLNLEPAYIFSDPSGDYLQKAWEIFSDHCW